VYSLARPFLFCLDAERAHGLGLKALETAYRSGAFAVFGARPASLKTRAFGIDFPNPVGLAAGLDKNGAHVDALMALGFGFVEVGTVTPRPQAGNPKPRMFRLPEYNAVINRLGFNNAGVDVLVRNVEKAKRHGILGINIGKNRDTPNERAAEDYIHCMERVYGLADYITVNISSPNTSGLRELQEAETLRRFIGELREVQEELGGVHGHRVPMLVKIAPDLGDEDLDAMASVFNAGRVDGVVIGNTTVDRSAIEGDPLAGEAGGLSGQPLYAKSTAVLRKMRLRLDDKIPLVGVGGILSGGDAAGKVAAGATLVQFYTGMVYRGPELVSECVNSIKRRREGVA
jgi:dihydroorotate dehydrogenase